MSPAGPVDAPSTLTFPRRPPGHMSIGAYLRAFHDNVLTTYPDEWFESDIVATRFLWRHSFLINAPAGVKRVLADNAANYGKDEIYRVLLEAGLGTGLLTSEGPRWRAQRRTMTPFFDHRSIAGYAALITEVADTLTEQWDRQAAHSTVDVAVAMRYVTSMVISRAMFSADADDMVGILNRAVIEYITRMRPGLLDLLGAPSWMPRPYKMYVAHRALGQFRRAVNRLIAERRRAGGDGPRDLLASLIAACDEETGIGLTARDVVNHAMTIFIAGQETTSAALTWIWYLLSQNPAAEAKLHAELEAALGGLTPRHEDLEALPYTRMVTEETLRLFPPAHMLTRRALGEDEILGHRIPRGSIILIAPWLLHRHRRIWECPDEFEPERFSPERDAARPRFSYIPFGAGQRSCIGGPLAMTEMRLVVATIAQRYRLHLLPGHPVEPRGLITMVARDGIKMTLERRR